MKINIRHSNNNKLKNINIEKNKYIFIMKTNHKIIIMNNNHNK